MTDKRKPDLRDQGGKGRPQVTPDTNDVKFAGARNPGVMPGSGKIVSPEPGDGVEGQNSKGS
jgi:hypothetical protein